MSNTDRPHARNAPSGAAAWGRCAGMLNFIDDEGIEDEGGLAADEGTILHSFCESALRQNRDAYDFVGQERSHESKTLILTDELADDMQEGLDWIDQRPGKLFVETRVDLQAYLGKDQFGTLDVGIAGRDEIVIFDWKWGYIPVSPIENYQLMLYALGFYHQLAKRYTDAKTFRLVIWQPRAPGGGGEWTITLDKLERFGRFIKRRAEMTRDPDAERTPGKIQCAYCPGAKTLACKEYADWQLSFIVDQFDEMDEDIELGLPLRLPKPRGITPERRSQLIEHKASIIKFLERLEVDELDDYIRGLPTPGRKAVPGRRPRRVWTDEKVAEKRLTRLLDEDAYTKKLLSPTQAEETLPAKIYKDLKDDGLIHQGERQPVMVSADDARDAIPTAVDLFTDDDD